MSEVFLSKEDVAVLTGCKIRKAQVAELRRMGLHFYVNARGEAVVPRSAVEGKARADKSKPAAGGWAPAVLS
ncbi:DUF4224 domain-containing protein [Chromobacterium piscinae]|uniref:DUF4224 domain-containing protein n=1 Tax=Chromobacterium piscinae TaxID=686831 RepID=UPI001E46C3D4|nr:DUF4224 domain-containing protein [Chromobacterium piscinae]MCD5326789.1 DUF4224 domain-containing protein [Chromobacterium piscinae]